MMASRKEIESLTGHKFTDAEWAEVVRAVEEVEDREEQEYLEKYEM